MAQEKRKPFKGKRVHKDLRDYKNQEIKRSLVHRARLRKNYFKLLEKEGVPEGHEDPYADSERGRIEEEQNQMNDSGSAEEGSGSEDVEESSEEANFKENSKASDTKKRAPLPPQAEVPKPKESVPKRKPLNFAERAKLARERKEQRREEELRRVQERRKKIEENQKERERKKLSLSKRTKRGQPVMGPKINDLLDKIRSNN